MGSVAPPGWYARSPAHCRSSSFLLAEPHKYPGVVSRVKAITSAFLSPLTSPTAQVCVFVQKDSCASVGVAKATPLDSWT